MLEKLNEKQLAAMPLHVEKYIKLGLATTPLTDESKAEITRLMVEIYKEGGETPPKEVLFFDSPVAALEAAAKRNGTKPSDEVANLCYGSQDAGWVSNYTFYSEYCDIDLKTPFSISKLCGLCSFWLPYDEAAFVSQNLSEIHMVDGVLHKTDGPSWSYADGTCGYTLFGTQVTKEIIDMLTDKVYGAKNILAITNVEQRLVAIKAFGIENMLDQVGAKIINMKEGKLGTFDAKPEYVLYSINLEGNSEKLLEMANPSEPKRHYEWVAPECKTVNEALAWRCGWEVFTEPVAKS